MKQTVLHPENLLRIPLFGRSLLRRLERQSELTYARAGRRSDPDISVVIRSRNNAEQLAGLLQDIKLQDFSGKVEVIVVDTESTDGSAEVAKRNGANVISIRQKDFSYPKALNLGFEAASSNWIFSLVDHSALAHRNTFKLATAYDDEPKVGGIWSIPLPNSDATLAERFGIVFALTIVGYKIVVRLLAGSDIKGLMGANCALYRRDVWEKLGKFDLGFGAGGEDAALGRSMIDAGYAVHYDRAMTVYHSHGLGFWRSVLQMRYWRSLNKPHPFNFQKIKSYRGKHFT